jgi:hypothetical protein
MNNQPAKKRPPLSQGETGALLTHLANNNSDIEKAAGAAMRVEILMRVIAELCEPVKKEIAKNYESNPRQARSPNYWNCTLWSLGEAIAKVFADKISLDDSFEKIKINDLRNKLLHIEWVDLMNKMSIEPVGLQISPKKMLEPGDIKDMILSMEKNKLLKQFIQRAIKAEEILEKILWFIAVK